MIRLMTLVSGLGTTFCNLAMEQDFLIELVYSQNDKAVPLATELNIPILVDRRNKLFNAMVSKLEPDLIILAGWTKLLRIPYGYEKRVLNIHPSLLPKYGGKGMYGLHVHEAVLSNKELISGCTVHIVDDEYDQGEILAQRKVPVFLSDTPDTLQTRVKEAEKKLYPEVIRDYYHKLTGTCSLPF